MLTLKNIAVGLVTQAQSLPSGDPRTGPLLNMAGKLMAVELTGRRQR